MKKMNQSNSAKSRDERVIHIAEYFDACSTRDRARNFYPELLRRLEEAASWEEIALSFEGVDFVSPSFLDETVLRLSADRPDIVNRLVLRSLSDFTARRLRSILKRRSLPLTLHQRPDEGEFQLT